MRLWRSLCIGIVGLLLLVGHAQSQPAERPVYGRHGMVVTAKKQASKVARDILKDGGNAMDAAVAAGFALAVVYPRAGNIGGGGFMVLRTAAGSTATIDFREKAPMKATRTMYQNEQGDVVPERSRLGHLASGVPGTVAGLLLTLEEYGTMSRAQVLNPAIRLAAEGFRLSRGQARRLNRHYSIFAKYESTKKYFTKGDSTRLYQPGELFVQKDLARVLRDIREKGPDGFYQGRTARLVVEEMEKGGGIITRKDLSDYQPVIREPVVGWYRGYRILSMGPPSSGGVAITQLLNAVEPYDLEEMGFHSSASIHLMGEAMRRVYADRAKWLGDSDFFPVPMDELTSPSYMRERMESFNPYRADSSSSVSHGQPRKQASMETTHYSITDSAGNAVSVTTTINASYGSKVVVDGAGFFLNNEMDDFSAKPGVPNMYGLIGGEANAIKPEKRMLSSMSPTIAEDPQGELFMVLGTPGGSTIITTVFQIITNVIDYGMNIQQAVSASRIHHQWLPDVLFYERRGLPLDVVRNLERRGWNVEVREPYGRANAIAVRERKPVGKPGTERVRWYLGAPDPREENVALGY